MLLQHIYIYNRAQIADDNQFREFYIFLFDLAKAQQKSLQLEVVCIVYVSTPRYVHTHNIHCLLTYTYYIIYTYIHNT